VRPAPNKSKRNSELNALDTSAQSKRNSTSDINSPVTPPNTQEQTTHISIASTRMAPYHVTIVGSGPTGMCCAGLLLKSSQSEELKVTLIDSHEAVGADGPFVAKGLFIGAQVMSFNVDEPAIATLLANIKRTASVLEAIDDSL
jgi:hypothetical protein